MIQRDIFYNFAIKSAHHSYNNLESVICVALCGYEDVLMHNISCLIVLYIKLNSGIFVPLGRFQNNPYVGKNVEVSTRSVVFSLRPIFTRGVFLNQNSVLGNTKIMLHLMNNSPKCSAFF